MANNFPAVIYMAYRKRFLPLVRQEEWQTHKDIIAKVPSREWVLSRQRKKGNNDRILVSITGMRI